MERFGQTKKEQYGKDTAAGRIIRKGILITLLFLGSWLYAADTGARAENIHIDEDTQHLFTAENGLPASSIVSIEQTPDGFIWLGGYGGLSRYDGDEFVDYEAGKLFNITDLLCSHDGTLWIASSDAGLVKYENDSFVRMNELGEGIETKEIECLAEAADGTICFGTEQGIGYVDADGMMNMLQFPQLHDSFIRKIACGNNGEIVCVTRGGEAFCCQDGECRKLSLSTGDTARCVVFDENENRFYISTTQDEIIICNSSLEEEEILLVGGLECINDIKKDENGNLWACADNGVAAVYVDGKTLVQNLKINNSIDSMLIDCEGNFWFASSRQGVLLVAGGGRFKNISSRARLSEMIVNAIMYLDGRLYIGHDEGLLVLDEESCERVKDDRFRFLAGTRIRNLFADREGRIWVSTVKKGLWVLDKKGEWKQYSTQEYPQLQSDNFRVAYETDEGMLVGTDAGAYIVTENGIENVVENADEMDCRILSIGELDGTYYFGTDGYGMYAVRDGKVQEHLTIENGLCSNVVMKMRKDQKKQAFWLVTGNNLVYYDPDQDPAEITFPSSDNLDVHVLEDGRILILTGGGVYVTTEKVLLGTEELSYKRFTRKDGLPYDITANSTPCMVDGRLYLCCSGGVVCMESEEQRAEKENYSLVIDYLIADEEKSYVQNTDSFTVPEDVQRIEIQAHLVTNTMENPTVFYYMEGFDKSKKILKTRDLDTVVYTNLNGGDYIFHFGEYDEDLGETGKEITLRIRKEYKWYERLQTRVILVIANVLIMFILAWGISKWHGYSVRKKLKKEYEELERARLEQMVYTDHMTGLYNRYYLDTWEKHFLEGTDDNVTFLSADCNNLKKINDEFGHEAGDRLLKETSALLQKYFDGPKHTVFRMGGDEFLVLCSGETEDEVREVMEKLQTEAKDHMVCGHPVSLCYGLHTLTGREYNMDAGIRIADMNMICQKREYHKKNGAK